MRLACSGGCRCSCRDPGFQCRFQPLEETPGKIADEMRLIAAARPFAKQQASEPKALRNQQETRSEVGGDHHSGKDRGRGVVGESATALCAYKNVICRSSAAITSGYIRTVRSVSTVVTLVA